ncbi:MAG TPA: GNAT family N-acetyltransferase [Polyangiales bacterium]
MHTRTFVPEQDSEFVFRVFADVRASELSAACMSSDGLLALLRMQHRAQLAHYQQAYPRAERTLLLHQQEPIGYWLLDRAADALTLVDFALLAPFRGRGLGSALLRELQGQARVPIKLRVRPENPARRLYERLGFATQASTPSELCMEWRPFDVA